MPVATSPLFSPYDDSVWNFRKGHVKLTPWNQKQKELERLLQEAEYKEGRGWELEKISNHREVLFFSFKMISMAHSYFYLFPDFEKLTSSRLILKIYCYSWGFMQHRKDCFEQFLMDKWKLYSCYKWFTQEKRYINKAACLESGWEGEVFQKGFSLPCQLMRKASSWNSRGAREWRCQKVLKSCVS